MIIRYPTALYADKLPTAGSGGNLTFLVSTTIPNRAQFDIVTIPQAYERRTKGPRQVTSRSTIGLLAFTSVSTNVGVVGSGKKHYEVGQVLEFGGTAATAVDPMLVGSTTEIQHDLNVLDLSDVGLSISDQVAVTSAAETQFKTLQATLSATRNSRLAVEVQISEVQKTRNETQKAFSAVTVLAASDAAFQPMAISLQTKLDTADAELANLTQVANDAAALATTIQDQLRALAQVVR